MDTTYHNGKCIQHRGATGRFRTLSLEDLGMVACPECGQLFPYEPRKLVYEGGSWRQVRNTEPAKCPACGAVAEVE